VTTSGQQPPIPTTWARRAICGFETLAGARSSTTGRPLTRGVRPLVSSVRSLLDHPGVAVSFGTQQMLDSNHSGRVRRPRAKPGRGERRATTANSNHQVQKSLCGFEPLAGARSSTTRGCDRRSACGPGLVCPLASLAARPPGLRWRCGVRPLVSSVRSLRSLLDHLWSRGLFLTASRGRRSRGRGRWLLCRRARRGR
jgi:hypothetical protein